MRKAMGTCAAFMVLFPAFIGAEEQAVFSAQVKVYPSTTVAVAENASLEIKISSNRDVSISTFALPVLNDLKIIKMASAPFKESNGKWSSEVKIEFLPLGQGPLEIPSLSLPYKTKTGETGSFLTPPVKIEVVNSLPPGTPPEELRDIKGPLETPSIWIWIGLLSTALLSLAAYYFYRKKPSAAAAAPAVSEPPRPLDEMILEKLEAAFDAYQKTGKIKEFYIAMSDIFREYLGTRFGFESLEKTTSEILLEMKRAGADRKLYLEANDLLAQCDLVKFAKFSPPEKAIQEDFEKIRDFVRRTHALG